MFSFYQVRSSTYNRQCRGQLICRGINHHHLFTNIPYNSYNNIQHVSSHNLLAMPSFLDSTNYQICEDSAQQLDSIAFFKNNKQCLSKIDSSNDNSISNETTIQDENSSLTTIHAPSTMSRTITSTTTNDIRNSNGYSHDLVEGDSTKSFDEKSDPDLKWINWNWPGSHTPCPFNPRNVNVQLSIQPHNSLQVRQKSCKTFEK